MVEPKKIKTIITNTLQIQSDVRVIMKKDKNLTQDTAIKQAVDKMISKK